MNYGPLCNIFLVIKIDDSIKIFSFLSKEYLKQLEQIRKQNYRERQVIKGVNNERASAEPPKAGQNVVADPKIDPDARRKKIQELKVRFPLISSQDV